jgi:hypothetical protein
MLLSREAFQQTTFQEKWHLREGSLIM